MRTSLDRAAGMLFLALSWVSGQAPNISGTITDSAGLPLAGASVHLDRAGLNATSGSDGTFHLTVATSVLPDAPRGMQVRLHAGRLLLDIPFREKVALEAYGVDGLVLGRVVRDFQPGTHLVEAPGEGAGVRFYRVRAGAYSAVVPGFALGDGRPIPIGPALAPAPRAAHAKASAAEMYDVLTVTKSGYLKGYLSVSKAETTGVVIKLLKTTAPRFSFFVTSMRTLQALAKNDHGFGGDLRFGETGPGAGLRGADKICATIAEMSMPGSSVKGWRAFLSVSADAHGQQVNAIDRIGEGPWYDRIGRLLAPTRNDLLSVRPRNGDPTIQNDLPNESGIPNHRPDPNLPPEDNHHMITGSNASGKLKSAANTCKDWTTSVHSAANGKPTVGFAFPRGILGGEGSNWMTSWDAPGCAAGIEITDNGPPGAEANRLGWIGGGGGYGGFYCFALNP